MASEPIPISAIVRTMHTNLIARHGLRAAVMIVRELHRYMEATLQEQMTRHPKEWAGDKLQKIPTVYPPVPAVKAVSLLGTIEELNEKDV